MKRENWRRKYKEWKEKQDFGLLKIMLLLSSPVIIFSIWFLGGFQEGKPADILTLCVLIPTELLGLMAIYNQILEKQRRRAIDFKKTKRRRR